MTNIIGCTAGILFSIHASTIDGTTGPIARACGTDGTTTLATTGTVNGTKNQWMAGCRKAWVCGIGPMHTWPLQKSPYSVDQGEEETVMVAVVVAAVCGEDAEYCSELFNNYSSLASSKQVDPIADCCDLFQ